MPSRAAEVEHPVHHVRPFPVMLPYGRLVGQLGDTRARIEERHEEHVVAGSLQRSEDVLLPCNSLLPRERRDYRPPVHSELVGMMAVGLDHVEDVGLELSRRMPSQSGEIDGEEEFEARPQLLGGLIDAFARRG